MIWLIYLALGLGTLYVFYEGKTIKRKTKMFHVEHFEIFCRESIKTGFVIRLFLENTGFCAIIKRTI